MRYIGNFAGNNCNAKNNPMPPSLEDSLVQWLLNSSAWVIGKHSASQELRMTLKKRGKYWYGDDHADIRVELSRYSDLNGYPIDDFADVQCKCGNDDFYFLSDEDEGVAVRRCTKCGDEHMMGDSAEFADDAEMGQHECHCRENVFQITAGIHRFRNQDDSLSNDVRWLYLGCRCSSCGLVGCYADWENEYNGYEKLLAMM